MLSFKVGTHTVFSVSELGWDVDILSLRVCGVRLPAPAPGGEVVVLQQVRGGGGGGVPAGVDSVDILPRYLDIYLLAPSGGSTR